MANLSNLLRSAQTSLARLDAIEPPPVESVEIPTLRAFVERAWPVIEPGTPFVGGKHIDAICEHLEAVSRGELTRLLINMPPRHAKSSLVSVIWPVWAWLADSPAIQWLCASYALSLAIRDNRKSRLLIQSRWFVEQGYSHFFRLAGDQNLKGRFENNHRGYRLAVSCGSAATGEGGTALIIDDAHPIDDSTSDVNRLNTLQWFDETWSSRLNDQRTGAMVVVGQRIHSHDLSGHILEQGGWEHLNLSSEYEPTQHCTTSIWTDWRATPGELLWPERFPHEVLNRLKSQIGTGAYAAQYQQQPVPAGGGQYRKEWFRYFTDALETYQLQTPQGLRTVLKDRCRVIGTVDLAISSKQTADYTAFGVWALTPDREVLLLDLVRGRFSNPEQLSILMQLHQRYYMAEFWKIEKVAYQLAFLQMAVAQGIPCREYQPTKDKVTRAASASVWYENGKVYHRTGAPWLTDFEQELLLFPKAPHDDMADLVPMACEEVMAGQSLEPLDDETIALLSNWRGW